MMSNIIQFLEAAGRNTTLTSAGYAAVVEKLDVDDMHRQALLDRNQGALNELLGGRGKMLFAIMAPEDEPAKQFPDEEQPVRENPEPEDDAKD